MYSCVSFKNSSLNHHMFFLCTEWNKSWFLFRPAASQSVDGLSADLGCRKGSCRCKPSLSPPGQAVGVEFVWLKYAEMLSTDLQVNPCFFDGEIGQAAQNDSRCNVFQGICS